MIHIEPDELPLKKKNYGSIIVLGSYRRKITSKTLLIPPQFHLNHTILDELEVTCRTLDGLLTTQLEQMNDIDALHETSVTSTTEIVAYCTLGLSLLNLILFVLLIYFLCSRPPKCTRCFRHLPPDDQVPVPGQVPSADDVKPAAV